MNDRIAALERALLREKAARAQAEAIAETKTREIYQSNRDKMTALGVLVAGVAHEVNTPLGLTYTLITHLQERLAALTDKHRAGRLTATDAEKFLALAEETLRHATANLCKATELIESFKQVAVDQTCDARRSFDLETYLNEIVRSLTPALRKGHHQVEITVAGKIAFDSFPGALSQVITNIVLNAVTHGFDGRSDGLIRIEAAQDNSAHCRIRIVDNGKGMPADVVARVFDPFFTTRRGQGGSGLGLHIAYNLVTQKLQGSIRCDSIDEQGTTITLVLPMSPEIRL